MYFWDRLELEVDSKIERKRLLADIGVAPNSLTTWHKRRTYPASDVLVKIAKALGVTVEYLVTGHDPSGYPARISAIAHDLCQLSDYDLGDIEGLVSSKLSRGRASQKDSG